MTGAAKSLRKGFTLDKYHIITKLETNNDTSGTTPHRGTPKDLRPVKASTQWKVQAPQCPVLHTKTEVNSYEFVDIVQIGLEQNILLACAVGGAERLISKQIYRSG